MRNFESFFKSFGFKEYPFSMFSAESERRRLRDLFVRPAIYSPLLDTFNARSSVVIEGDRGTGKTALIYELMRNSDKSAIYVYVEDFSDLQVRHVSANLYQFLIDKLSEELFKRLADSPWKVWSKTQDEKLLLSYLLKYHVTPVSLGRIEEKIRNIQVSLPKRFAVAAYNYVRGALNYGASSALNITSDLIKRHFPWMPTLDDVGYREYFPALGSGKIEVVELAKANYSLLGKICDLVRSLGFSNVVFVMDKVDEEPRLENDAKKIADFLSVMLADNKLLLHENMQILLACWSVPLGMLKSTVRFQKLSVQRVSWQSHELQEVLNQRLLTFSGGIISNYGQMLNDEARIAFSEYIVLANGNPRDLWHLMDTIIKKQYEINSDSSKITEKACRDGAEKFVCNFNFYEYYPRASDARSDSMDVYSYIAHLLKLDSSDFTKNLFKEKTGAGSSTNNYVLAMENMGLISKSDEKKDGGAVVYVIRDPKIEFARQKGLKISRSNV